MSEIFNSISQYGVKTVLIGGIFIILAAHYKTIFNWTWATFQAAAIVKNHEQTIQELKEEVKILRERLEEYNVILMEQSKTIARLEERIIHTAKTRVSDRIDEN